uniref:Uncharacterized protein n=1 Tax=Aegilops tauschii subsp. strangulata TaxID=200361 RepID=A0A453I0K4_AEGTS
MGNRRLNLPTWKDSSRAHQHLKLLLSQLYNFSSFRTPDSPGMQEQQHEQAVLCNISRALSVQRNYSGVSDESIFDTEVEDCSTAFVLVIITCRPIFECLFFSCFGNQTKE